MQVVDDPDARDGQPALVFGQRGKLRAEGPFLGLLAELEKQMSSATQLAIIGYSFRDDHVNELIQRWCQEDIARTILVIDPAWPDTIGAPEHLASDFRAKLNNYLVPWADGEDQSFERRLYVQRERCSEALPLVFGEPVPAFVDSAD